MSAAKITKYPGKLIDVFWDGRLCIHIGECGQAQGDLFVGGRQPWCQPDLVAPEAVTEVVERCPSGALSYTTKEDAHGREASAAENTVTVSLNGPLFVRGELQIEGVSDDMPGVSRRAALCRCGHSKNKPFCDNSHEVAHFRDYGAVGEQGEPLQNKGGILSITPRKDGPLIFKGNFTIMSSSGRAAWQGEKRAMCRCGQSKNKPFCDGSHTQAGFKSE